MRRRDFLAGAGAAAVLLLTGRARGEGSTYDGPLFDAHTHSPERGTPAPTDVIASLKKAGIAGVAWMGRRTLSMEESLDLRKQYPDFVFPLAQVPGGPKLQGADVEDRVCKFLDDQLATGLFKGIGEVMLRHKSIPGVAPGSEIPADGPFAARIYAAGAKHKLPVNVHVEGEHADEMERALQAHADCTIVWAHGGDLPAARIGELMRKYPNLYADVSCRNPLERKRDADALSMTDRSGALAKEWLATLREFPDRFLFGLDLCLDRYESIAELTAYYRRAFAGLPRDLAEKVAHRNAKKLLGLPA